MKQLDVEKLRFGTQIEDLREKLNKKVKYSTVKLFYGYSTLFFGFLGTIISMVLFFLHEYVSYYYPQLLYILLLPVVILIPTIIGSLVGYLIDQLQMGVYTDSLTQLWNRRYFNVRLNEELKRVERTGSTFCLALVDIDDFKKVNDSYGHSKGDELLINMANILKQATRNIDILTRWGGDEFAIVLPDTNLESSQMIIERIQGILQQSDKCHNITISVGILSIQDNMETAQILRLVDERLYEDKRMKDSAFAVNAN